MDSDLNGTSFYLEVNGISLYAKGGDYIPPDMFMPRVNKSLYDSVI